MGGCFWIWCLLKRDFFEIWRVFFFLTEREREGEIMNNGLVLGATSCWATSKTPKGPFDRLVGVHLIFEPTINWFRGYSFIFRNVRKCGESPFVFFLRRPCHRLGFVFFRWFFRDSTIGFMTMIGRIYGGFLKWWVSPFHTPSADHFYLENPWVCWGNPSFLDTPPYLFFFFASIWKQIRALVSGNFQLSIWILLD